MLQLIRSHSYPVKPSRSLHVTPDPDDNKFLECADAARADYLVTGNQRFGLYCGASTIDCCKPPEMKPVGASVVPSRI